MLNKITIIIPVYNEAENMNVLIDEIFYLYQNIQVLIIDDFSTDNTVEIVKEKIKNHSNLKIFTKNIWEGKWLTFSIIKGINSINTEYFIVMDWDFQHPISNISNFIRLFWNNAEIIIWERKKIIFDERKYRIFISKIWNILINYKLRNTWLSFVDPLSGYFGWKTKIFNKIIQRNSNIFIWKWYKFLFEFLKCIKKWDFQIDKFNYNFSKRKFWESKITLMIFIEFIKWIIS